MMTVLMVESVLLVFVTRSCASMILLLNITMIVLVVSFVQMVYVKLKKHANCQDSVLKEWFVTKTPVKLSLDLLVKNVLIHLYAYLTFAHYLVPKMVKLVQKVIHAGLVSVSKIYFAINLIVFQDINVFKENAYQT